MKDVEVQTQRIPLDFAAVQQEVVDLLEKNHVMTLATCSQGRVSARAMSVVHAGLTVYFQTGAQSLKHQQLVENPNVALCAANMAYEGRAADQGHPLAPENAFFAETYSKLHPGSFQTYSHLSFNRLIEVQPVRITLWKYSEKRRPFQDFLDLEKGIAWREWYPLEDGWSPDGND